MSGVVADHGRDLGSAQPLPTVVGLYRSRMPSCQDDEPNPRGFGSSHRLEGRRGSLCSPESMKITRRRSSTDASS
jgi:hypothetical protein